MEMLTCHGKTNAEFHMGNLGRHGDADLLGFV